MILTDGNCVPPFNPKFTVVGCFVLYKDKMLFLRRHPKKPQGNTFGIPSGKVEPGEPLLVAMARELREETGLQYCVLHYEGYVKVRFPEYDFTYAMFSTRFKTQPRISMQFVEHTESVWVNKRGASKLPLIQDMYTCIKLIYPKRVSS